MVQSDFRINALGERKKEIEPRKERKLNRIHFTTFSVKSNLFQMRTQLKMRFFFPQLK